MRTRARRATATVARPAATMIFVPNAPTQLAGERRGDHQRHGERQERTPTRGHVPEDELQVLRHEEERTEHGEEHEGDRDRGRRDRGLAKMRHVEQRVVAVALPEHEGRRRRTTADGERRDDQRVDQTFPTSMTPNSNRITPRSTGPCRRGRGAGVGVLRCWARSRPSRRWRR